MNIPSSTVPSIITIWKEYGTCVSVYSRPNEGGHKDTCDSSIVVTNLSG